MPLALLWLLACGGESITSPDPDPPEAELVRLPIVVHVVHHGTGVGVGPNLSEERIRAQIRTLNEDFRRRVGTPGFNTDSVGGDARIEFVLAERDPDGAPTSGIHRVDASTVSNPVPPNSLFNFHAHYGHWDPERYVNVWTMPLGPGARDIVLGLATGPDTDLPGAELLLRGEPEQAEGILINADHFGPTDIPTEFGAGRTLTHEMGHYLGLLHLWGDGECADDDHCADTPAVGAPVIACTATTCGGQSVAVTNYMTFAPDACMRGFTLGQIARMRHVLEQSDRRRGLPTSDGLIRDG